ncbi:MAG: Ureidoglycolate lyase [Alphaproteobacteria bacterium MarineAlpha3_Bin5]|nr:5-carboxymethyl-2-hydroxymuconate isomerase [Magnetovibrio sp.]PPR78807.1 MAG: Ureidoglycolate lyase [Alphaproteobacteria bacterium MarineAlpha3_Bin5]
MKIVSFEKNGIKGFGAINDEGIIDLTNQIDEAKTLKELIERNLLKDAGEFSGCHPPGIKSEEISFLPVIPNPGKIICVGLNYFDHVNETGRTVGEYPCIFHRYQASQVGHRQPMIRPIVSEHFDFEAEMAVILGGGGRHIDPENALSHIAGYACYNEGTIRDWQGHTSQFAMGKNFLHTGAFGPWMVTADEIPDYKKMNIVMRLNGKEMQRASLKQLIFDIPTLISYVSRALPWEAGDVLVTGTPGGVGFKRNPPVFLKPGDVAEVEISMIGTLINPVADEEKK